MLKANGGLDSYHCSCLSDNPQAHCRDCQCRCETCDEARSCPCTPEHCDCLLLCNCQCRYCHTIPRPATPPRVLLGEEEEPRQCIVPSCSNHTSGKTASRCHSCKTYRKLHRKCAAPGCPRFAPRGGYAGNGRYCAECCSTSYYYDHDPAVRRVCKEKSCTQLAPMGCPTGKRCPKCASKRAVDRARVARELRLAQLPDEEVSEDDDDDDEEE